MRYSFLIGDKVRSINESEIGTIYAVVIYSSGHRWYKVKFKDFNQEFIAEDLTLVSFFEIMAYKKWQTRQSIAKFLSCLSDFFRPLPIINVDFYRPKLDKWNKTKMLWFIWHRYIISLRRLFE